MTSTYPRSITTRADLLQAMGTIQAAVLTGIHAFHLATDPSKFDWAEAVGVIQQDDGTVTRLNIGQAFAPGLANETDRDLLLGAHQRMLVRSLIRDPFELLTFHTARTNERPTMTGQPWYRLARVLRNCASHHDFGLREWRYDDKGVSKSKRFTSVSWDKYRIDKAMVGQGIKFGLMDAVKLFNAEFSFAETLAP